MLVDVALDELQDQFRHLPALDGGGRLEGTMQFGRDNQRHSLHLGHKGLAPVALSFPARRGAWAYWTPYYYIYIYTSTRRTSNPTTEQLDTIPLSSVQGFKEVAQPWYTDQILPFDITIAAANEYGAAASAKLYGVEILNEGFGTSVDDSVLEQQATFIARSISPLQAIGRVLRKCGYVVLTWGHARVWPTCHHRKSLPSLTSESSQLAQK